jgi:hypothetical protein
MPTPNLPRRLISPIPMRLPDALWLAVGDGRLPTVDAAGKSDSYARAAVWSLCCTLLLLTSLGLLLLSVWVQHP